MQFFTITAAALTLLTPISASPALLDSRATVPCVNPPSAAQLTAIIQGLTQKITALQGLASGLNPGIKRSEVDERDLGSIIGGLFPIGGSNPFAGLIAGLKDIITTAQGAAGSTSGCPVGNPLSAADASAVCDALTKFNTAEKQLMATVTSKAGGILQLALLQPVAVVLTILQGALNTLIGNIAQAVPGCTAATQGGVDASIKQAICAYLPLGKLLGLC